MNEKEAAQRKADKAKKAENLARLTCLHQQEADGMAMDEEELHASDIDDMEEHMASLIMEIT
ncbi:hypothetical protein SCP_0602530 [Sparassis crispa]|uniref:Uncharacterized protein n=1 Tax=Sparassis crispa TaxID=139825 RepID=A0A401GPW2_9APHY|nr:hypothetical protein SCP_0602530 [Sparassis crispa]GBE84275.1 hypothetical protein SCP_0602530 [Sparassis crispa]